MMYDYLKSMKEDIQEYINDNYYEEEIKEKLSDSETWAEELSEDLWICDSVTGNASGSYTFNRYVAKEYVTDNTELLMEALKEFCVDAETIADKFLNEEWEYFDVTIRCYLLYVAISETLEEMEK